MRLTDMNRILWILRWSGHPLAPTFSSMIDGVVLQRGYGGYGDRGVSTAPVYGVSDADRRYGVRRPESDQA